jgi:membrane protein
MIAEIVDFLMSYFEALAASGAFKIFANLLLLIMSVYLCVWLIIGGMKVASGQQKATDLFLNVGKFIGAYIIIFYVSQGSYVKDFLELSRDGIMSISKSSDQIINGFSDPLVVMSRQTEANNINIEGSGFSLFRSKNDEINDSVEKFISRTKEDKKIEVEKTIQELNARKRDRENYCAANKIESCSTKYYDTLLKEADELKALLNSPAYDKQMKGERDRLKALLKAKDNMSMFESIIASFAAFFSIILFMVLFVICVIIVIPFWFRIFELALNFGVSCALLICTIPIAAVCLIYGKWFKDIFKAWFNRALSNFIQIPILAALVNFLIDGVNSFPPIFGFSLPSGFSNIISGALLGRTSDIYQFDFLYKIGCVLFLWVFTMIAGKLLEIVQKFLDDLVGSGFNASSGAISTVGSYVAGAATGIAATAGKLASGGLLAGANVITRGMVNKVGSKIGNGISSMASVPSRISKAADSSIGRFTGATGRQQKAMQDEARKAAEFDREKDLQLRAMRAKDKVKK